MSSATAAATLGDASLAGAFASCERITRSRARNFYYGLRLTPEPKRSAMFVVYAWMRIADDLADGPERDGAAGAAAAESVEARRRRLEDFRAATDLAFAGAPRTDDPLWAALACVAARYQLSARDFHDMVDGQIADLEPVACRTWDELRTVCYRVASTVGLVCIRIWGADGARAQEYAIARGIAFQLTNILRDVREDHARGRVYLPLEEFERYGLTPESFLDWRRPERCEEFVRFQIARAESHYRASEALERLISVDCVPTLWAMTEIYRRLLRRIEARPRESVAERVRLPRWEKLWIALKAKRLAARPDLMAAQVATP